MDENYQLRYVLKKLNERLDAIEATLAEVKAAVSVDAKAAPKKAAPKTKRNKKDGGEE